MLSRWMAGLLALAAGTALPLAFAPFGLYPLAVAAPALLFALWFDSRPAQAFRRGYLFGLGMFATGTYWVFISMYDFGGVSLGLSLGLTLLFVAIMALFPALVGAAAGALIRPLRGRVRVWVAIAGFPACWSLGEWVRGWFLTGFPWLSLGYSQIDGPLSGYAPVLGVYGVSLMAALSAALVFQVFRQGPGEFRGVYLLPLVGLWLVGAMLARVEWTEPSGPPITASLVQGDVPQEFKWHPALRDPTIDLYMALSSEHWDSDLIVWPETAIPLFYDEARPYLDAIAAVLREHRAELLAGLIYQEPETGRYYNSMVTVGAAEAFYHKRHLVPFTEFLPLKGVLGDVVAILNVPMSDFQAGSDQQRPVRIAGQRVGVSICYEDAFGEELITMLPEANLLVNVSNDGWFGGSIAPHQHVEIARMRALETGRYLLRATNTGVTAVIDDHGDLQAVAPQFEATVISAVVQPRRGSTPYAWLGNHPAVAISLLMVLAALWLRGRPR